MKKVGAICDIVFTKHMQFQNYYYALTALYGGVKLVHSSTDLKGLDMLFIGGAFHGPHMGVYMQEGFIEECNKRGITVVLVSAEKIISDLHPTHVGLYNIIAKSKKFVHYTYDIDDCKAFGTKLFRLSMSKHFRDCVKTNVSVKNDKIVFIGCMYKWRRSVIEDIQTFMDIDVFSSVFTTWEEYMRILSRYRFVLSPLGDANAFVTRFYEILLVHSIPVQQVSSDTLQYYNIEAGFPDCIFFKDLVELKKKINQSTLLRSVSELWLEDRLGQLLKEDNLL